MEILAVCALGWCALGGFSVWIAAQKGRSLAEGFLVGFLFGPLGVIVEALLPTLDREDSSSERNSYQSNDEIRSEHESEDVMKALGIDPEPPKPLSFEEFLKNISE